MFNPLLSDQEAQFVNHFLVLGKATEAARRAGYSESFAKKKAYQLLKREAVREAIAAGTLIENQEELSLTRQQAISLLSAMSLATPDMLLDPHDGLAILSTSGVYKQAIREFTTVTDAKGVNRRTTLKFCNKISAIRELRMLKALEVSGEGMAMSVEEPQADELELERCADTGGDAGEVDELQLLTSPSELDPPQEVRTLSHDLPENPPTYREESEEMDVSHSTAMSYDNSADEADFAVDCMDLPSDEEMEALRRLWAEERQREAYRAAQRLRGEVVSEEEPEAARPGRNL